MHHIDRATGLKQLAWAKLPREVGPADADQHIAAMRRGGDILRLDWRDIQRIDRFAGCIVTSPLIGVLDDLPIDLKLPESQYVRSEVLDRSGFLFALAQREGAVQHDGGKDFTTALEKWRNAVSNIQLTWDASKAIGGLKTGPRSHAWTNLHRRLLNYSGNHFARAMKEWLGLDVLQARTKQIDPALLDDVALVSNEILENVIEHGADRNTTSRNPRSLAHAMITEGGRRSYDRLYLTMQDNGPGIEATARPKLGPDEIGMPSNELIERLIQDTLMTFPSQRGRGLPRIWGASVRNKGSLWIASGNTRVTGKEGVLSATVSHTQLDGTAIVLMFPILGE